MARNIKCSARTLPALLPSSYDFEPLIGLVFRNRDGVLNLPRDAEDVLKSMQWFGNAPQHLYLVSDREIPFGRPYLHGGPRVDDHVCENWRGSAKGDVLSPYWSLRIEASTDPKLGLPRVPASLIEEYVNAGGRLEAVWLDVDARGDEATVSRDGTPTLDKVDMHHAYEQGRLDGLRVGTKGKPEGFESWYSRLYE